VVHAHVVTELQREFPSIVARRAGAQMHHRLPQDVRLVSEQHLRELGPIDLVVAGWPCQGSNAAGTGLGLDDARSRLFTELVRILSTLQSLHHDWGQPLGYLIEYVAAGTDRRPIVRAHFEDVHGILGPELVLDAAQLGSRAHRLRAWWTNLEGMPLLRAALGAQSRSPNLFVHQMLGPGRQAKPP
jgi:site-specific DNA-cytosine methylase